MIQVGVLGAGNHSKRNHGPALERCRDERPDAVELRAVCDLDRDRAVGYAEEFGFDSTYENFERMLAVERLDALVAVTPVDDTRDVVGELLTCDVAVLVEKPPGRTASEARELERIAAENDTPHAVSFNRRFNPALVRAREWIAEHAPDEPPTQAHARLLRTGRYEDDFVKNTGLHAVDTVCAVLGRPTHVSARQRRSGTAATGRGTRCAARATFPDASAQFTLVSDAGTRVETYELFGPEYTVRIDTETPRFTASSDGETAATWRADDDAPAYERNGTLGETRAFLEAVRRGEGFAPTLSDAVPSVELATAMNDGGDREIGRLRD